jgi:hypothetical protein
MRTIARALAATSVLCLVATACDTTAPTRPDLRTSQQPALNGIGMVGSGGRSSADSTQSGTTSGSTSTTSPSGTGSN